MTHDDLATLLAGNRAYVDALEDDAFSDVLDGQAPPVVSICCSDSRVPQQGMFDVDDPGWLFTPSTIGNQVTDEVDGERVVDGSLLYPVAHTGTRTIAVVGHTGCGAVTAAYETVQGEGADLAPGIAKQVQALVPIVEDALDAGRVDETADRALVIDQLVEANVHAQVRLLVESEEIPEDAHVYGLVYDLLGTYGGPRGRTYLVNVDGEANVDRLAKLVPDEAVEQVASILA